MDNKFHGHCTSWISQGALVVKNLPANAGDIRDAGLTPGLGRSPGRGNGNPLEYSCLENHMDRGDCQATVHWVAKSWTQLKRLSKHIYLALVDGITILSVMQKPGFYLMFS